MDQLLMDLLIYWLKLLKKIQKNLLKILPHLLILVISTLTIFTKDKRRLKEKEIDWETLLNFIEQYINRKEFWKDKFIIDDCHTTYEWIVGTVSEIMQYGTRDDLWAFHKALRTCRKDHFYVIE